MKLPAVTHVCLCHKSVWCFIVIDRGMVGAAGCTIRFGISTSMFIAAIFVRALAGLESHAESLFLRTSPNALIAIEPLVLSHPWKTWRLWSHL